MIDFDLDWSLYVILDPDAIPPTRHPVAVARQALEGGATVLQLRDKTPSLQTIELARALKALCDEHLALFVINDDLELALAVGAPGLHLGPEDMSIQEAKRRAPQLIVGGSAGSVERALELEAQGADYLGVGAIFDARPSKPNASAPRGPDALRAIVNAVQIPCVGIGGINEENARQVIEAGAKGVAVIRAVCAADDPKAAAQTLRAAMESVS